MKVLLMQPLVLAACSPVAAITITLTVSFLLQERIPFPFFHQVLQWHHLATSRQTPKTTHQPSRLLPHRWRKHRTKQSTRCHQQWNHLMQQPMHQPQVFTPPQNHVPNRQPSLQHLVITMWRRVINFACWLRWKSPWMWNMKERRMVQMTLR